ncbi:MAG: hypothetical protein IPM12_11405 [Flavobacteriales bacterium]|nr:hypothetical protein [Flavobacteriales bacterium]
MARDAMEVQEISALRQQVADLHKKVETPTPKYGKLHSSCEAWSYIAVSERTFRDYVGARLVKPVNPDALKGEHYRFSKAALDEFLMLPSGTVRTAVAMYRRRKEREREKSKSERTTESPPKRPPE